MCCCHDTNTSLTVFFFLLSDLFSSSSAFISGCSTNFFLLLWGYCCAWPFHCFSHLLPSNCVLFIYRFEPTETNMESKWCHSTVWENPPNDDILALKFWPVKWQLNRSIKIVSSVSHLRRMCRRIIVGKRTLSFEMFN